MRNRFAAGAASVTPAKRLKRMTEFFIETRGEQKESAGANTKKKKPAQQKKERDWSERESGKFWSACLVDAALM
jgi:hypothetical protein